MKAVLDGSVIAEARDDELISIEGNWYFPRTAVRDGVLVESPTPYTCPWKGVCQYYTVQVDGREHPDRAWTYLHPYPLAIERVGADFTGYVAFWKEVEVVD